jgi:hypothetical protein
MGQSNEWIDGLLERYKRAESRWLWDAAKEALTIRRMMIARFESREKFLNSNDDLRLRFIQDLRERVALHHVDARGGEVSPGSADSCTIAGLWYSNTFPPGFKLETLSKMFLSLVALGEEIETCETLLYDISNAIERDEELWRREFLDPDVDGWLYED